MKNKILALLLALLFLAPSSAFASEAKKPVTEDQAPVIKELKRVSGRTRYETAVEISKETFPRSDRAIIAYGDNFPDAMFGGKLAVEQQMPILLVRKYSIPEEVHDELSRLGVKRVYILGGEAAISKDVERELLNDYSVRRISGRNRFYTAMEINYLTEFMRQGAEYGERHARDFSHYVVTSGTNFADALGAAPLIAQAIPDYEDSTYPRGHFRLVPYSPDNISYGQYIIGGPAAVPNVDGYISGGIRIAGPNRYATAVEIAKMYPYLTGKFIDTGVLANGRNYPDALASAPLVGKQNAALLLTTKDELPKATRNYLLENPINKVIFLGGEGAISRKVVQEVDSIIRN